MPGVNGMNYAAVRRRRMKVKRLMFRRMSVDEMAAELGVCRSTIKRDLKANRIETLKEANALTNQRVGAMVFENYSERVRHLVDILDDSETPKDKVRVMQQLRMEDRSFLDTLMRLGLVREVPREIVAQHIVYDKSNALDAKQRAHIAQLPDKQFILAMQEYNLLPAADPSIEEGEFEEIQ